MTRKITLKRLLAVLLTFAMIAGISSVAAVSAPTTVEAKTWTKASVKKEIHMIEQITQFTTCLRK